MKTPSQGALRLFTLFGIDVYLHLAWFLVLAIAFTIDRPYESDIFRFVEVIALFTIILMHEFGHALACRSVGGDADHIMLWPLGGIAFARPPKRPGATLWTIAAGPLVNVALAPILFGGMVLAGTLNLSADLVTLAQSLFVINLVLLIFNMLPIYPMDGGQILQSLLWFKLGWAKSVVIAGGMGVVTCAIAFVFTLFAGEWWLTILSVFIGWQALQGLLAGLVTLAQQRATDQMHGRQELPPDMPPMAKRRVGTAGRIVYESTNGPNSHGAAY